MKKVIYASALLLVVGGFVFANRHAPAAITKKRGTGAPSAAEAQAARKAWEATPDGVRYKNWEASPAGRNVLAAADKIRKHTLDSSRMEAVVTTLSLPPETRLGFAVIVRVSGEDYFLSIAPENAKELEQLKSLKAGDKIVIKARAVSWAPKYALPILSGDYVERGGKILYKRIPRKGGC